MASEAFEAKYPGTCKKCQKRVEIGERVRWAGKGVVQHERCSSAWREAQSDPRGPILPLLQPKKESAPEFASQAELDELFALDDALSSVPMVEARDVDRGEVPSRPPADEPPAGAELPSAGTVGDHGSPGQRTADVPRGDTGGSAAALAAQQLSAPAAPDLVMVVQELRSIVGSLAATVRVLATAVERIAAALPPDKYLVPKDHWTRAVEPTAAGAEMQTGDPF